MDHTNTERQARWRQRQKARAEKLAQAQGAHCRAGKRTQAGASHTIDPINAITPAVVTPAMAP